MKWDIYMKKIKKEDIYSILALILQILALILQIISLLNPLKITLPLWIPSTVIFVSSIWIFWMWRFFKLKKDLANYEKLLANNLPMYGLMKYLFKGKKKKHKNLCQLYELQLQVSLVGDISKTSRNDLNFSWALHGINTEEQNLEKIYFRFSGENTTPFSALNFTYFDCTHKPSNCSLQGCEIVACNTCANKPGIYNQIEVDDTYSLIEMFMNTPIPPKHTFNIKLNYTWPQCYNSIRDYLILDPNNFSDKVEKLTVRIMLDGVIITEEARVKISKIQRNNVQMISLGKVPLDDDSKYFYKTLVPEKGFIYLVEIEN